MIKTLENFEEYRRDYYRDLRLKMGPMVKILDPIGDFLKEAVDTLQFCMRCHLKNLPKIIEDDRFKQALEDGADQGPTFGGATARKEAIKCLFGINPDRLKAGDFPKFGYLTNAHDGQELFFNASMSHQYGAVMVVFKKENLLHRTTLTVGNSINFGAATRLVPTMADNILPTCIQGLPNPKAPVGTPGGPRLYMEIANLLLTGKLAASNVERMGENFDDAPGLEYLELQYHGPLSLSRDVEAVYMCPWDDGDDQLMAECAQKLTALGIKNEALSLW